MSQRVAFKHLVGVAALLVISACVPRLQAPSTPAQPPSQAEPEVDPEGPVAGRVGVLLPLTGDAARFGEDLMLAMTMAVQRLNDERFELVLRDTAGTQEGAIQGAEELIEENVSIILGPLYGTNTGAVAPIAREAGIPVLSLSNQARFAGDGVFALGYGPEEQVERVTAYAVTQGYTQIAALASDDTYGQKAIDGFNRQINRQFGTEITGLAFYPTDQSTGGGSQATADVVRRIAEFDSRKAVVD
ncbi:MAG: penicillin-binding protein activator [Geminicoccaceae bacterium]